jgi:hypothetical protein
MSSEAANHMSNGLKAPTFDEIKAQAWQEVAREAEHPTYTHISTRFSQKAAELEKAGDLTGANVYSLLNNIVFIHLDADNKDQYLRPAWISDTVRSEAMDELEDGVP